jgi:hypothetical protein
VPLADIWHRLHYGNFREEWAFERGFECGDEIVLVLGAEIETIILLGQALRIEDRVLSSP